MLSALRDKYIEGEHCIVSQVKLLIFQELQIPPLSQKLFCGPDVLADSDHVYDSWRQGDEVLTLLLVTDSLTPNEALLRAGGLTHEGDPQVVLAALDALAFPGVSQTPQEVYSTLRLLMPYPRELFGVLELVPCISSDATAETGIGVAWNCSYYTESSRKSASTLPGGL